MFKDKLIANLHKLMRTDPVVNEIMKSSGLELDEVAEKLIDLYENLYFFDTATWGLILHEKEVGIKTDLTKTYESRRAVLEAKWKGSGKLDLELINTVCDSWKRADVDVKFIDGKINIKFIDTGGVPEGLEDLKDQIEDIKPAHLAALYLFSYITWDLYESFNWTWDEHEAQNLTWDELEVKVN